MPSGTVFGSIRNDSIIFISPFSSVDEICTTHVFIPSHLSRTIQRT